MFHHSLLLMKYKEPDFFHSSYVSISIRECSPGQALNRDRILCLKQLLKLKNKIKQNKFLKARGRKNLISNGINPGGGRGYRNFRLFYMLSETITYIQWRFDTPCQ